MSWLNASFTLFGERVLWTDLIGNILSLAVVVLAMRKTIWTWPVQLAGALLLLAASLHAGVPGNALKQVLFCVLAVYGYARWTRGLRSPDGLKVRLATGRERLALLAALAIGTAALTVIFTHLPWLKNTWLPWANAYLFVGSAVATFGQGRGLVDFWIVWVLVDLVGVPLAIKNGLYASGVVYGIFFVMVIVGFWKWLQESRTSVATADKAAVTV